MSRSFKVKHLSDQTIVITEAASAIGYSLAKLAAARGAKVVLASTQIGPLEKLVADIIHEGGKAIAVKTDVSRYEDLVNLKNEAIRRFQGIDTWVNNAGISMFGYLFEANPEDERKLFDVNFWGTKNGSLIAIEAMLEEGGTLINLGSEVAVSAQPLLGMYSASKSAVKEFTEALRSELKDRSIPIEICLVRPTTIDSPAILSHEHEDLHHPNLAAVAILKCIENPQRDIFVGGPARLSAIIDTFFPQVKDIMAESKMKELKRDMQDKKLL